MHWKCTSPQFIAITSPLPQPQPPNPLCKPSVFIVSVTLVRPSGRTSQGEVPGPVPLRALSFPVAFKKCALRAQTL